MALTQPQRGKILAAVVTVLLVGGLLWGELTERAAHSKADDLHRELVSTYGDTDAGDIPALFPHEHTEFFRRSGHDADTVAQVDGGWRARYRVEAWGEARCAFVTWTDDGAEIEAPERCP